MINFLWRLLKVKVGWKLSPPAEFCPDCKDEPIFPTAYNDAGDWYLHWYCDVCGIGMDEWTPIEWPMKRNFATVDDLKRLGFYIV
jgi:hypothetical protein